MHLEQHADAALVLRGQPVVQPDHRDLDEVGRRPLDRRVGGGPLPVAPHPRIPRANLRDVAAAADERLHVSLGARPLLHLLEEVAHPAEPLEVLVDEGAGLRAADPELRGEGDGPLAVDGREVDRLRLIAHRRRHGLGGDPEDAGRRLAMDVPALPKRLDERRIAREMSQDPELDL